MSQEHPELVFITGPQAGQRVVLKRPAAVLGRSGEADILLSEEFASRAQLRYELVKAGPTLENLSARGTWINGKRFKSGKRVLVETGDVIGVGSETQILFVAAGDDPEQAAAEFRSGAGGKDAFGRKLAPDNPPGPPPMPVEAGDAPPPDTGDAGEPRKKPKPGKKRPSEMTPGERAELERKAKQKKLIIGLAAWWGAIVVAIMLLRAFYGGRGPFQVAEERILSDREIRRLLEEQPREVTANVYLRDEWLQRGMKLHGDYGLDDPWKLNKIVLAFKEALAYSGRVSFDDPRHQRLYRAALDRLAQEVTGRYRTACILERKKDWARARDRFGDLLQILSDENERNPVFRNVQAHLSRVKHLYEKQEKAKKPRGWFG